MNSYNRLTVKGAAAAALILVGAVAHMGTGAPKAQTLERYSYTKGQLLCDVGQGPLWGEMQIMVKNLR